MKRKPWNIGTHETYKKNRIKYNKQTNLNISICFYTFLFPLRLYPYLHLNVRQWSANMINSSTIRLSAESERVICLTILNIFAFFIQIRFFVCVQFRFFCITILSFLKCLIKIDFERNFCLFIRKIFWFCYSRHGTLIQK